MSSELEDLSLFELFRMEAEEQVRVLQNELLQLERGHGNAATLEALMRAAHSLKGAARILGLDVIVHLTHAMEERFVAAQAGNPLAPEDTDRMLQATDWLARLQATPEEETAAWLTANTPAIASFTLGLGAANAEARTPADALVMPAFQPPFEQAKPVDREPWDETEEELLPGRPVQSAIRERTVRIAASRFDQILSLVAEGLVASRALALQSEGLERNRRAIVRARQQVESDDKTTPEVAALLREIDRQTASFTAHIAELDLIARANERTSESLYRTVLAGRLRPFSEGIPGAARLVRDTARELGKQVHLEVQGEQTRVDRDILERLEAPLSHLLTNALDHGLESPADRILAGKPAQAQLKLRARHENGRLVITLRDDGRGIQRDELREHVIRRGLASRRTAEGLADSELLEFLFLPGFSTREEVSTVSGRGVGLNVVQSMVQEAGGSVVVTSEQGAGTTFRMTLPVTRSVVKVLRLQAEGDFFAVPLGRIDRVTHMEPQRDSEGSLTVELDGHIFPVRSLASLLGLGARTALRGAVPMLLCGGVAFSVDRFIDEIELPVRRLDSRLGKIPGVSAASLDENGLPLLILDMEDLIQTALGSATAAQPNDEASTPAGQILAPHILVVDDSHTVREIVRRLLARAGYTVTNAQNGQEAWNLLRLHEYDLLVSDVDMPQMNGIELVTKVRADPRLARMPVMILSYKDHDEDRRRGLEAGADFYLTKGDFQKDTFRQAVVDLIGPAVHDPEGHA